MDEKNEEPTAKRLKEARKQGDLPFSEDLFKSSFLIISLLALSIFFWKILPHLKHLFHFSLLHSRDPYFALQESFSPLFFPLALLLFFFFFLHFVLHYLQRGFLFAFEKPKIKSAKNGLYVAFFFLLKGVVILLIPFFFFQGGSPYYFALTLSGCLCALSGIDFLIQKKIWKKRMKMSKQEILEERKENEVSPSMKQKMRER